MSALFDHQIIEQLHSSARSLVHRATAADGTALIVKAPNQQFPSFQQLAQFKREYAIARLCRHPGVIHPLALQLHGGRWTMLQEDIGGQALDRILRAQAAKRRAPSQPALPLDDFVEIALQLCAALEAVHRQGVIHKDINPSNLVWNGERRLLQLIDFGIACELPYEQHDMVDLHALEGTLHYMAPEQTGRMNRRIDYRADYYALGATFYELLTGQTPFAARDEIELVHCHIARSPDWSHPALASLPGQLLAIMQRLLEKNADQRYQSLQGLRSDLAACLAPHAGQALSLSNHDARLLVPQTLYGREEAIAALLAAFGRSAAGASEMLLVAGHSGIGKSALVNEVQQAIVARRGCFLSGKFDQLQRDMPYASLIQAFQGLVRQLLGQPEAALQAWADKLRGALGDGLGVIVGLIPQLALIVGPVGTADMAAPELATQRLDHLFARFVEVFACPDHPLVLFLDDLQWADAATLRMIERLMVSCERCCLLFIGAYRDNEVAGAHPLAALRDKLPAGGVRLTTVVLAALTEPQVAQLVSATVRVPAHHCAPLTRLCYAKTAGNPFFLNQFLATLDENGHLRYRAGDDCWDWDLPAIERARYTDNVVEALLEKIRRLPRVTQHLLQLAASSGSRFTLSTLALVLERSPRQTQRDLWPALHAGLIQPLDERYKYVDDDGDAGSHGVSYQFQHDRVQQAAYLLADADARMANHLLIGRRLLRHAASELPDKNLFEIVEQLNAGRAQITDHAERAQLAALNLQAGVRARCCAAFQATLQHMRTGLDLLPEEASRHHAGLWFELQLGAAEAAYLCGQFDAAEAIYPLVRAHAVAPLLQVRCIAIQAHQYQLQGRLPEAIAVQRAGLAQLNVQIPHEVAELKARFADILAGMALLHDASAPATLLTAAEMVDPVSIAAMKMMHGMWMAAYYAGQQDLSALMVVSMTRLSMQQGNSDCSAAAYVAYAMLLTQYSADAARGHAFGAMALLLARRRANLQTRTQTALMFAALINHWTQPLRSSDALYEEAFGWALEIADFVQVGVVAAVRATERLILGDYLPQLLHDTQHDLALMRANGQQAMADCCVAAVVQPIKCLTGDAASTASYDDAAFSEAGFLDRYGDSVLYRAYFLQGKIRNASLFDTADAERLAAQLDVVTRIMRGQAKVVESTLHAALIWIRALRRDPLRSDAGELRKVITALQDNLAQWARPGSDHGARHVLVQAEMARLQDQLPQAARLYQQAIDAASLAGYVNLQALGNELCGECWLEQRQPRVAAVFLRDAIAHYGQWGAQGKVAQLQARHAALLARQEARTRSSDSSAGTHGSRTHHGSVLDMVSLMKAAQILSNEVGLRNVLTRLIAIVCENAGAQVARLLLLSDGAWHLEADMDGEAITVLQARRLDLDAASDPQFPLSLLRYAVRTGLEVIEDSMTGASRFAGDPYVPALRPRAVMCLPIVHGGGMAGMLYFENRLAEGSFTAERVAFLRMLGAQAMISISSARLHDSLEQRVAERTAQLQDANRKLATLSITDGLTGLANRRHFDNVLRAECTRPYRAGQSLAVMMLDVDHFKRYNDRYGHQAGDACLARVAQALASCMRRASDLVARYGGEEFSIVLPDTSAGEARQLGEALRQAIEDLQIVHASAGAQQVTISIGIAVQPPAGAIDPDTLLRLADAALYDAKHAGRNGVVLTELPPH